MNWHLLWYLFDMKYSTNEMYFARKRSDPTPSPPKRKFKISKLRRYTVGGGVADVPYRRGWNSTRIGYTGWNVLPACKLHSWHFFLQLFNPVLEKRFRFIRGALKLKAKEFPRYKRPMKWKIFMFTRAVFVHFVC